MNRLFKKLWQNERGSVLIESAFIIPLLALAVFGTYELSSALSGVNRLQRFSAATADSMAILGGEATESQINTQLDLSNDISGLSDMSGPRGRVILTAVRGRSDTYGNETNQGDVLWRRCNGGLSASTRYPNPIITLPNGMTLKSSDTVMIAETYYDYDTPTNVLHNSQGSNGQPILSRPTLFYSMAVYRSRNREFSTLIANPGNVEPRLCG